ncbi:MAG: GAF domain-containing protein [Chromatiales bacterium]|jgi:two-component system nitrate/nitrite sensor histidine kinase NarX|nr:GAF domain-containing protein [Chromatiales bacterium]MDX9767747.1 GAF domain-containing protein [Ectothiorhodospiraceae bacterium]
MIQPAIGWRHKTRGMVKNRLFLPLVAMGIAFLCALAINAWILFTTWSSISALVLQAFFLLWGFIFTLSIPVLIYRHLVSPLFHLRHWAQRVRGGNLSARIPVPPEGEFAELAQDVNALSEQLQRLTRGMEDEVRRQTEQQELKSRTLGVLYDVAASINISRDVEDLITRFLHALKTILNARAATARLVTEDGQMRLVASLGFDPAGRRCRQVLPLGQCLCGQVATDGEVQWKVDVQQCGRVDHLLPEDDENAAAMIAVPLQYRDRTLGVYNLFLDEWPEDLDEDMHGLLVSIGRHLGMAIEKARLDQEANRLSIMEERTRLAHELHDSLAQTLASLRFRVRMLDESLGQDEGALHREVSVIQDNLNRANTELRELITQFRAPVAQQGLVESVAELAEDVRRETGINVYLQKEWKVRSLPVEYETQVLRIVQEALVNVRKHAGAQNVRVMMRATPQGDCRVLVEDDGSGMAARAVSGGPGEHIGLSVMEERATRIGGELRIESEPGEGTRMSLSFQYPRPIPMSFSSNVQALG